MTLVLFKHEKKTRKIVEKYFKKFVGNFSKNTNTTADKKKNIQIRSIFAMIKFVRKAYE